MGTNYYLKRPTSMANLHLGKSSLGWCFSLHVYPEQNLRDWGSMLGLCKETCEKGVCLIESEYGEEKTIEEFIKIVTERHSDKDWESDWWGPKNFLGINLPGYLSEWEFHEANKSERGPNGLLRHRVNGKHCIAQGEGTWD